MSGEDDDPIEDEVPEAPQPRRTWARDPLAEAEEVLRRAAEARGANPDEVHIPRHRPGERRDPLEAAREALENAARIREQVGESPRTRLAEDRARAELERLKATLGAPAPRERREDVKDPTSPPVPKKRRL